MSNSATTTGFDTQHTALHSRIFTNSLFLHWSRSHKRRTRHRNSSSDNYDAWLREKTKTILKNNPHALTSFLSRYPRRDGQTLHCHIVLITISFVHTRTRWAHVRNRHSCYWTAAGGDSVHPVWVWHGRTKCLEKDRQRTIAIGSTVAVRRATKTLICCRQP